MALKKLATKAKYVQPGRPESTGSISANGTQEVGHEGEAVQPANPEYTDRSVLTVLQEVGHTWGSGSTHPEYTGPISANGTQEVGYEGEALPNLPIQSIPAQCSATGTQEAGPWSAAKHQPANPGLYWQTGS